MFESLTDKVVLVTGASKGIGKEIAAHLLTCNAIVAIHYHTDEQGARSLLEKDKSKRSKIFQADLSSKNQIYTLVQDVLSNYKKVDTVICNAAVFVAHSVSKPTKDWFEVWKTTIQINLHAVGLLTKLFLDHFQEVGEGRFIYIGSRATFRGETEEYLAYAASKGGITSLARSVARSFGKQNIKAFVVAPGFTKTAMAQQFIAHHGEEKVLQELALNELTTPKDIAPFVAFLSAGLLDHATGATFDINAGSHIR
ncbi:SDR family NAD(P)-dependent oxidoreductase [Aquimarina brevivitae]|uniref:NAD(P)-dependent dehydrogenase (Short-subunit alcohol dehydrogenase family) n=1 Tax=Aquimarina brevivitae TaxID=323412 RepID=A0A4V2F5S0_9FLAO|nr:SDR family oxidoreductase [Aquimarina brevivitae]RZS93789.1 NAD(P)-dependent dehydrogenase (short-subunit alcohol dehydrogenase family) [Aquimarina brevivitae]